jgi:C4-dicarboxylate transporter DctQ subunit
MSLDAATEGLAPARAPGNWFTRFERGPLLGLATALMLGAMGLMFYEAASRMLLGDSHWWAEEAVRFLVVWSVMLAFGVATRQGNYIRMELMIDMAPRPVRRFGAWLNCLCGLTFSGMVVVAGMLNCLHLYDVGMMTESNLDLPLWLVRLALPIGALFYALYFVSVAIELAQGRDEVQPIAH